MNTVKTINEVRNQVKVWKKEGYSIALVPTMGSLHAGHASLISRAAKENEKVVVSIFVNPIQFGPSEDLDSYPRDLNKDEIVCEGAGADLIFAPKATEMYYKDIEASVSVKELAAGLCGAKRPNHFAGVCTVVSKLFNIIPADKAYFGQKDAQQLAIIKRMVRDLNFDIEIIGCPIIREKDGLAKSSRNVYLSPEERQAALILNKSLTKCREALSNGERSTNLLKEIIKAQIQTETLARIDYIEIVDALSLDAIDFANKPILVAIAIYIGKTRLIDNFIYEA
ncbi:pantoate--beta-alanine ligase [Clostridium estertheticum]|uniref:Pantothenate synthetase n=1 Tax=Clostridium estertheticum subsp. estertheticum TaxID=1552 RepID=A0A1J0GKL8_9CLOT|nr:pantoate--beta-alanine ligase [Clostridium estertheticum]APC41867.1 pantoate--beta-alanine ligase [Clostridium estertheticum subsp. estertheticum]MBU3173211.1 pantoate--beta-alanine ligase [Clostridium estertheticum]MBZ9616235.1 pantoate--beta-alanine ligase [Clostridium estertheticum subsp. laramiense]WAG71978.1 pantoate--beta-alanine ligase [Clostridium estertheticum]